MELPSISWAEPARHGGEVQAVFLLTLPLAGERVPARRVTGVRTLPRAAVAYRAHGPVGVAPALATLLLLQSVQCEVVQAGSLEPEEG